MNVSFPEGIANKLFLFFIFLIIPFISKAQWTQVGLDIDGEAAYDASGSSISMNSSGDRMAIGAVWNFGSGQASGHVRVYEWDSTTWVQLGADIDGEAKNDESGNSVSMNEAGDRLAILEIMEMGLVQAKFEFMNGTQLPGFN